MMKLFTLLSTLLIASALVVLPVTSADTVRACLFVPGTSVPAQMPSDLLTTAASTPFPTVTPPSPATVSAETTARQLTVFNGLWNAVHDHYVYPDFLGHDWGAMGDRYEILIQQGLSDDTFYAAMGSMVTELGDEHSYFQSPAQIAAEQEALNSLNNFVGIGALFLPVLDRAAVVTVNCGFPG